MSPSKVFNSISGKVVSTTELKEKLEASGFREEDFMPSQEKIIEQYDNLVKTGKVQAFTLLAEQIQNSVYLPSTAFKKVEDAASKAGSMNTAIVAIKLALQKECKTNSYAKIESTVQMLELLDSDHALIAAFVKAVEACVDHQPEVGKKLQPLAPQVEKMVKKLSQKFDV